MYERNQGSKSHRVKKIKYLVESGSEISSLSTGINGAVNSWLTNIKAFIDGEAALM